jgi:hypothetical protein
MKIPESLYLRKLKGRVEKEDKETRGDSRNVNGVCFTQFRKTVTAVLQL